MSELLPLEAERYVVPGSVPETIRNLTDAAERGEFGYEIVALFAKAVSKGRDPRFAKTKPVPLRMREAIEAHPELHPRQVIYRGLEAGLWTWEDVEAFENNAVALCEAKRRPEPRGVYLTRNRRRRRRLPDTGGQFVPKMSLDAVCAGSICDGAKTCLSLILARAGKSDTLVTYTVSLASHLGRTPRTIRNYFIQLEEAGLIRREPGRHPNTVKITILPACRPEPYHEPLDVTAFKLARRSKNEAVRALAETVVLVSYNAHRDQFREHSVLQDRRKEISAFNPESNGSKPDMSGLRPEGHYPGRTLSPPTSHSRLLQRPGRPRSALPYGDYRKIVPPEAPVPASNAQGLGSRSASSASSSLGERMAFLWK